MSSILSAPRQRIIGTRNIAAPSSAVGTSLYVFIAAAGNYVGNYPPGYVVTATTAGATFPALASGTILRDTGKTIKAVYSSTATQPTDLVSGSGFWREVQLILPQSVSSATAQTPFGVGQGSAGAASGAGTYPAGNAGDDGYGTFYVPIAVGGVIPGTVGALGTGVSAYTGALLPDGQL